MTCDVCTSILYFVVTSSVLVQATNGEPECALSNTLLTHLRLGILVDMSLGKNLAWHTFQERQMNELIKGVEKVYPSHEFALIGFRDWTIGQQVINQAHELTCYSLLFPFTKKSEKIYSAYDRYMKDVNEEPNFIAGRQSSLSMALINSVLDSRLKWDAPPDKHLVSSKRIKKVLVFFTGKNFTTELTDTVRDLVSETSVNTCLETSPPTAENMRNVFKNKSVTVIGRIFETAEYSDRRTMGWAVEEFFVKWFRQDLNNEIEFYLKLHTYHQPGTNITTPFTYTEFKRWNAQNKETGVFKKLLEVTGSCGSGNL